MMQEEEYVGSSEASSAINDDGEDRGELELALTLGVKKVTAGNNKSVAVAGSCRILTAKDFPLPVGSRDSPISSSSSVSSCDGTKRVAGCSGSDTTGSNNPPSPVFVGWPPVRAVRHSLVNQVKETRSDAQAVANKKNSHYLCSNKENNNGADDKSTQEKKLGNSGVIRFVKVNMDGDPIGRKVDLNDHLCYETLALALELMFHMPTTALSSLPNGAKASSMMLDGSTKFALTYEDKDGDWMLVGDVPWGMFLETVKRLRIMRSSDANGLGKSFHINSSFYRCER